MFLLRVLKSTYELLTTTDVIRAAKSSFRDVGVFGLSTRLLDGSGGLVTTPVFVGGALEPSADGASALVTVKPGLALWYDSSEADVWLGEVRPVFFDTEQTVAFTTNTDGSGNDRIDVLSVRPVETEEDVQVVKFKDPIEQSVSERESPQRTRLTFEFVVTEGTVAASPVAPATPAGTFKIAEVLRVNAQANVNPADVTDSRQLDRVRAGFVDGLEGLAARVNGVYFGDPAGAHYRLFRDDEVSPTELRLRDEAAGLADLDLGVLRARNGLLVNDIGVHSDANETIDVLNAAATNFANGILARNTALAYARFGWNDPGGALPNDDPADELSGAFGITSILWKVSGSDKYAEVTLDNALPSVSGTLVQVTCGATVNGSGSVQPDARVATEVISTTVIRLYFSDAAGALIEPVFSTNVRNAIHVYSGVI